jgi:integrase
MGTRWTDKKLLTEPVPKAEAGRVIQVDHPIGDGLFLRVSSTGRRAFCAVTRLKTGKQIRMTLGPLAGSEHANGDGLTLTGARLAFQEIRAKIEQGIDPRIKALVGVTFAAVAERFLQEGLTKSKLPFRPATVRQYTALLLTEPAIREWQARPLTELTRADIAEGVSRIAKRGAGRTANLALAVWRRFFGWACNKGLLESNPATYVEFAARNVKNDRHLFGSTEHPSEIGLLWEAAEAIGRSGAIPKLLLLTGARHKEVAGMRRSELHFENGEPYWTIPGDRAKTRTDRKVPLLPMAVKVIQSVPPFVGCDLVFGVKARKQKWSPPSDSHYKKQIVRYIKEQKKADPERYKGQFETRWRFQDLRHTVKTGMTELGIPDHVSEAIIGHKLTGIAAWYTHAELMQPMRDALRKWEEYVRGLVKT